VLHRLEPQTFSRRKKNQILFPQPALTMAAANAQNAEVYYPKMPNSAWNAEKK
jgi:hypothetical protein